jgi:hypothetical protein
LLSVLLPQLIEGAHPAMEALRAQYRVAAITEVELTGVGFFVDFEVPPGPALTDPRNFTGGHADITLAGASCRFQLGRADQARVGAGNKRLPRTA